MRKQLLKRADIPTESAQRSRTFLLPWQRDGGGGGRLWVVVSQLSALPSSGNNNTGDLSPVVVSRR